MARKPKKHEPEPEEIDDEIDDELDDDELDDGFDDELGDEYDDEELELVEEFEYDILDDDEDFDD